MCVRDEQKWYIHIESQNSPSDGCSKPKSAIARSNSGFNKKSRKPVEWIPTYDPFLLSFTSPSAAAAAVVEAPFVVDGTVTSSS